MFVTWKDEQEINLGPVDLLRPTGVSIRINVKLPFDADNSYIVTELHQYAAIIHKSLPLDTTASETDLSLSIFSVPDYTILSGRGYVDPEWFNKLDSHQETTFIKDGYVVAIVKSSKYKTGALAALPISIR